MVQQFNIWLEPIEASKNISSTSGYVLNGLEVAKEDAPELMTWVKADEWAKTVGNGWRLPTKEELLLMYKHKEVIGGFKTESSSGSDCPQWYWSCTELREHPVFVWFADFSDGNGGWTHKDSHRLSCRLVRLVPVPSSEDDIPF